MREKMSKPTQAQIEASVKAIGPLLSVRSIYIDSEKVAIAVLTAAAEVGEPSTLDYAIGANFSLAQENEKLRKELAATIERCAQVVEQMDRERGHKLNSDYAAAIRALKDRT